MKVAAWAALQDTGIRTAMRDRKAALDNSTDINITENLEKQGADKIDMVRD